MTTENLRPDGPRWLRGRVWGCCSIGYSALHARSERTSPGTGKEPLPGIEGLLPPSGVTLMEVLISIFILAVGLMGLAALLPVGGSEIAAGVQAERAATVGAAAMREIQVRHLLQPVQMDRSTNPPHRIPMWYWPGNPDPWVSWDPATVPYVLMDPLGVGAGANRFPMSGSITMPRLSVRQGPRSSWGPHTQTGARALFVSRDDVLFDIPSDRRVRARLIYRPFGGGAVSSEPTGYTSSTCRPEHEGNYSWMAMLGPPLKINPASQYWRGWASVIVMYKRNLNLAESELVVPVSSAAMTEVGGEIVVTLPDEKYAAWLQRDRWILLASSSSGGAQFQWHRIVAAARPNATSNQWYITLMGDARMGPSITPQQAILVEGVVGVFSRMVELELEPKD